MISTHPCTLVCVRNGIGNRKGNRIGESGNLSVGCFGLWAVSTDSFGVRAPLEVGMGSLYWFDCFVVRITTLGSQQGIKIGASCRLLSLRVRYGKTPAWFALVGR